MNYKSTAHTHTERLAKSHSS